MSRLRFIFILLSIFLIFLLENQVFAVSCLNSPPSGATYCIPFGVNNIQTSSIGSNTQIMLGTTSTGAFIGLNTLTFSASCGGSQCFNNQLSNFAVYNTVSGQISYNTIWIEAYNAFNEMQSNGLTSNALIWFKIPDNVPASTNDTNWALAIYPLSTNNIDKRTLGLAPQIYCAGSGCATSYYGEADNGNSIFDFYDNFTGTSSPNWIDSDGSDPGAHITLTTNNGFTWNTLAGTTLFFNIFNNEYTVPYNEFIDSYISSNAQIPGGTNAAGFGVFNTPYSGTPAGSNTLMFQMLISTSAGVRVYIANPFTLGSCSCNINPDTRYVISGLFDPSSATVYKNYTLEKTTTMPSSIVPNSIMISAFQSGSNTQNAMYQWIRTRTSPPNGVYPIVNFGSVLTIVPLSVSIASSSATTLDAGQSVTFAALAIGGTGSYTTYNFIVFNSITNVIIANSLQTSNSFIFTSNSNIVGNTIEANVIVTDSASHNANSPNTGQITINPAFTVSITPSSTAVIDAGQDVEFAALATGGSSSYTTYNFIVFNSITNTIIANSLQASNTFTFASNSNIVGNTLKANVIVIDSASSTANSINSALISVNSLPSVSIFPSNILADSGQIATFTITATGGTGPFAVELYNITGAAAVYNAIITNSSGALNSWAASNDYPANTYSQACSYYSDFVYCVGGYAKYGGTSFITANTYSTQVFSDALGSWTGQSHYPFAVYLSSCPSYSGYIYCIGGYNSLSSSATNIIYSAQLSSGSFGTWNAQSNYPIPIQSQSCNIYSGYIYCVGGYDISYENAVYSAPVSNGIIGSWTQQSNYPLSSEYTSCSVKNAYIYCIGGYGTGLFKSTYSAPISGGIVGTWTQQPNYPNEITGLSCIPSNSYIYCLGGKAVSVDISSNAVYSASISSGTIGSWMPQSNYPANVDSQQCISPSSYYSSYIYCFGGEQSDPQLTYNYTFSTTMLNSNTLSINALAVNGNTFAFNAIFTDEGTSPYFVPSSQNSLSHLSINPALSAEPIFTTNYIKIDTGQSITLSSSLSNGFAPYFYQWYSGNSTTCSSNILSVGNLSSTLSVTPYHDISYCYKSTDNASEPEIVYSATNEVVVNSRPSISIITSNVLYGQIATVNALLSGGTGSLFNFKFYNVSSGSIESSGSITYTETNTIGTGALGNFMNATAYPFPIQAQGCITYNYYIYCVAGYSYQTSLIKYLTNTVYSAQIQNGTVSAWTQQLNYPSNVYDHQCTGYSGYIYCIGGINDLSTASVVNSVFSASISGGTVGSWVLQGNYPMEIGQQQCEAYSGYIYCVGGASAGSNNEVFNSVYSASISGGTVGSWVQQGNYPVPDADHTCTIYSGYIYCLGGQSAILNSRYTSVYSAPVSGGTVGTWTSETSYPVGLDGMSCNAYNGNIYCIGGDPANNIREQYIYSAPISSGTVGSWSIVQNYNFGVGGTSCNAYGGYIYCVGGFDQPLVHDTYAVYSSQIVPSINVYYNFSAESTTNIQFNAIATDEGTYTPLLFASATNTVVIAKNDLLSNTVSNNPSAVGFYTPVNITFTGTPTINNQSAWSLYVDGTFFGKTDSTIYWTEQGSPGTYSFTFTNPGNANYTSSSLTSTLKVGSLGTGGSSVSSSSLPPSTTTTSTVVTTVPPPILLNETVNLIHGSSQQISFSNTGVMIELVSNTFSNSTAKLLAINVTAFSPNAPIGFIKLSATNITSNTTKVNNINVRYRYPCSIPAANIRPFILKNGIWNPISLFIVNATSCIVSFSMPADPVVAVMAQNQTASKTPSNASSVSTMLPTTATAAAQQVPSSTSNILLISIIIIIIIIIAALYMLKSRRSKFGS